MDQQIILLNQAGLNHLVRELNLPKESAQLLGHSLKEKNLLEPETIYNCYLNRETEFKKFFISDEDSSQVYCSNIVDLIRSVFNISYDASDWKLFIDLCENKSFKAFLLNKNNNSFIPIGYSSISVNSLLAAIDYQNHLWPIYGDFKIIEQILGVQEKQPCILCLWNKFSNNQHYTKRNWPSRQDIWTNKGIQVNLSQYHIKLHLVEKFIKALDKKGKAFAYLYQKFDQKSMDKIKAGLFDGPEIRKLVKYHDFHDTLNPLQLSIWLAITIIIEDDLSIIAQGYIDELMENFNKLGVRMSLKMHFLYAHLDYFKQKKEDDLWIEQITDKRYRGRWNVEFMADCCWSLLKDNLNRE